MSDNGGFVFDGEGGYPGFEDAFRGSHGSVSARLAVYLPLMRTLSTVVDGGSALDIGCGRGEWLQLLGETGISASGCDADGQMVERAAGRGLAVCQADGLAHLQGLPADSLMAVTAFHLIEHLALGEVQRMFREAHRVLATDGVLLIETPNPENLRVAGCDFYTDPTHRRPLPPRLVAFLLSQAGFSAATLVRLNPDRRLRERLAEARTDLERELALSLYGPQDLGAIGVKAGAGGEPHPELLKALQILTRSALRAAAHPVPDGDVDALQRLIAERDAALGEADLALEEAHTRIAAIEEGLQQARRQQSERDAQLAFYENSLSWRVTAPLRLAWRTGITLRDRGLGDLGHRISDLPRRLIPARMPTAPLISCLCVTRGRADLLARAIRCFQAQSWPHRELVVVYEDDDLPTRALLARVDDRQVRTVEVPVSPKLSLGELRNLAIEAARGRWFCQWDDDDWHHRDRLAVQWQTLRAERKAACVLMHWLVHDGTTGRAFISPRWHWEGSILCDRQALSGPAPYAAQARAEDTPFVQSLAQQGRIACLVRPGLYIYVYHGRNVWDRAHWHDHILSRSPLALASGDADTVRAVLADLSVVEGSARIDAMLDQIGPGWRK